MENASRAFLDAIRKSMRQIRSAIGATTIDLKLLTAAEHLQYEGYLRREETNATILALSKSGAAASTARHLKRSGGTASPTPWCSSTRSIRPAPRPTTAR